jgi:hypothetical protein
VESHFGHDLHDAQFFCGSRSVAGSSYAWERVLLRFVIEQFSAFVGRYHRIALLEVRRDSLM